MRTAITVSLGVLLAAAFITGVFLYQKNTKFADMIEANRVETEQHRSNLAAARRTIDQLKAKTDGQQHQIQNLQNENRQASTLKKELDELMHEKTGQINKYQDQIRTQKLLLATAEKKIEDLKSAEKSLQTVINSNQAIMEDRNKELKTHAKSEKDLSEQLSTKEVELTTLQEKHQRLVDEVTVIRNQIGEKDESLLKFKNKLSMALDEKGRLERHASEIKYTYEQFIKELQKEIVNKEAKIQAYEKKLTLTLIDRILFDFSKATITDTGKDKLKKVGDILSKLESGHIRVEGHTDDVPISKRYRSKFPSNWELSAARAAAVVNFFIRNSDLKPSRIEAVGHAFYKPIASNSTSLGRAQNRRVEVTIVPD